MDYYEEFGVSRSATPEQIRRAHKNLVRLLHPDQFQDPELQRLAETQLKRVNEIAAVLSDPDSRREYDSPGPAPLPALRRYREYTGWGVAAAVAAAWLLTALLRPAGRPPATAPAAAVAAATQQRAPAAIQSPPERQRRRADASRVREIQSGTPKPEPASIPVPPPALDPPKFPLPDSLASLPAASPPPPVEASEKGFAGRWLYAKPSRSPAGSGLYPPEYIEAVIAQDSGVLRGRYRARYLVRDRAISPEVIFRFEGAFEKDSAALEWVGDGGSRGEVHLRLVSADSLEVNWFASEMGSYLGLASGSAILTRQREP